MTFLDPALELSADLLGEGTSAFSESLSGRITHAFVSSAISYIDYDEATQVLYVTFRNGGPYEFTGVPRSVVEGWLTAASAGGYYNRFIRGVYS